MNCAKWPLSYLRVLQWFSECSPIKEGGLDTEKRMIQIWTAEVEISSFIVLCTSQTPKTLQFPWCNSTASFHQRNSQVFQTPRPVCNAGFLFVDIMIYSYFLFLLMFLLIDCLFTAPVPFGDHQVSLSCQALCNITIISLQWLVHI